MSSFLAARLKKIEASMQPPQRLIIGSYIAGDPASYNAEMARLIAEGARPDVDLIVMAKQFKRELLAAAQAEIDAEKEEA